jgi:tetratricopeptide (TPR) repeat protein
MNGLPSAIRYFKNLSPLRRIFIVYSAVFTLVGWANFTFIHYRIAGNLLASLLPDTGVFMLYLWIILFFDEFLFILQSSSFLSMVVHKIKIVGFILIGFYAFAALVLLINGTSIAPIMIKSTKVVSISNAYLGSGNYGRMIVQDWDGTSGTKEFLLASRREAALYTGEDVEVVLRRGIFYLNRVLEIRKDSEKYYLKMLQASSDSKVALKGLIDISAQKNQFEEALVWYAAYTKRFIDDDYVGYSLGCRLVEGKRFGQAVIVFKEALKNERTYRSLYMLGYSLAWAGQKYEAEKYLKEATELDPTDFRAYYSLGYVYNDTGRYDQAKEAWSTVLTLMPHFPEVENKLKIVEQRIATMVNK